MRAKVYSMLEQHVRFVVYKNTQQYDLYDIKNAYLCDLIFFYVNSITV